MTQPDPQSQSADLVLMPLGGIPAIAAGDDLAATILAALASSGRALHAGDVVVLAQKIVSKAEGRIVDLRTVKPTPRAVSLARATEKDPRLVELILSESTDVLRHRPGVIIVAHRLGLVLANAGIDRSNVEGDERALLLPVDPDGTCARIRSALERASGVGIGVMIIDSVGRAWRNGTVGTAIGISGMPGLLDLRGRPDLYGRPLETTELGFADELAAAASLVMGQAGEGRPVVIARGLASERRDGSAQELIRTREKDLFR